MSADAVGRRGSRTDGESPALAIESLCVPFGGRAGLTDVTLSVVHGERLAILGPSGAGKTTLLRAVAGLAPIGAGRVRIAGRDVAALPPERRSAVYLHQSPVLFAHLSVAENVAFSLRVRGSDDAVADARVREALATVRLSGFESRRVQTLSGGQAHRVALARAIASRPAALLLDEPLAALDPALRDEVREAIATAQADYGPAMLLVTHDLDDAALLADRVAVLLAGGVAQVAPPELLFTRPATLAVARFLGLFQELPGDVRADGGVTCPVGNVPMRTPPPQGAAVVVAARAEAFTLRAWSGAPECGGHGVVCAFRHRARGSTVVVRVHAGGTPVTVEALASPGAPPWKVGDEVAVALDPQAALVFPA